MATATTAHKAHELGQSIWYDNIRRELLRSGELARLVQQGVRGVTSNPTIFEKAISGSTDYDDALRRLVAESRSVAEIYEDLVIDDIRQACDVMRPLYESSAHVDGRVSIEVLPELASNTDKTVAEGQRLHRTVARDNVMIKVPATPEGIPAVRALTARGVSVNVTLIFSVEQYKEVAEAFIKGLEERAAAGGRVEDVISVASFFLSRIDTSCDKLLAAKLKAGGADAGKAESLFGKAAIANAKLAYEHYNGLVASPRWKALAAQGARPQRLLWASTGTKDPRYSDTMYVDALIGPDTVDTVPPATLSAFLDHGKPGPTLAAGLDEAKAQLAALAGVGVDLGKVCRDLLTDGVKAFETSMTTLIKVIAARREALLEQAPDRTQFILGGEASAVEEEVKALGKKQAPRRLWDADPTLFTADPAHETSIKTRLGWLTSPDVMDGRTGELRDFADEVRKGGFSDAVLLGMGGSSLCPEVFGTTFGTTPGYLRLHVLDNTDPAAIAAVDRAIDPAKTLFLVASKSGGTIEIKSFEKHYWKKVSDLHGGDPGKTGAHFVAITDPGTQLEKQAADKRYRRAFINMADIGGRYSALSYFGLLPAALIGADIDALVDDGVRMAVGCAPFVPAEDNPGVRLGAVMGALAARGRDKVTFIASPEVASLGSWIEQLIAESTGKIGKGIVPIDLEPVGAPAVYGNDRLFAYVRFGGPKATALDAQVAALEKAGQPVVRLGLLAKHDLGGEFFRWEVATAIAGASLGLNPFDEPNVTEAKEATAALLAEHAKSGRLPTPEAGWVCGPDDADAIRRHLATTKAGDYVAFCAYVPRSGDRDAALARMRVATRDRSKNATTLGYGPRFLHSTGQLHKGGANNGVFLQITADVGADLPIPGEAYTFGTLRDAQALGDLQVLKRRGRRALRVHLGKDIDGGLARLARAIEETR